MCGEGPRHLARGFAAIDAPGERMRPSVARRIDMALDDRKAARREALFGGRGAVRVWDMLGARQAPPFAAALWCELDPGGSVGRHVQEHFPELVIGIEGQGEARVDDRAYALGQGDAVHLPLGSILAITNLSSDHPLRYLIVKASS
jgi:quercetin dioxygenase-like cupin family protein